MKKMLLIFLALLMLLGAVGCQDTVEDTPVSSAPEESYVPQYVSDPAINRFIIAFQKQRRYVMAGRTQNSDGSCSAEIDACRITMVSTTSGLHITLEGGDTAKSRDRMLDIFATIAKTVDAGCTDDLAQKAVAYLKGKTANSGSYRVSNYVRVLNYVPVIQTDTVQVDCRMEFLITHYLPEAE